MGWWGDVIEGYNWLAKSHQQLYDDIHGGLGLGGGQGTIEHYDTADRALQQIQQRIEKGVKELSANWSGAAADGATALTRAAAEWANAAAVATIHARGQSLHQASAYVDAKNKMPEPVRAPDISPAGGFPSVKLLVDVARAKERAGAAHLEAARVMTSYNSSTTEHIGAMPQYPAVSTMVSAGVVAPTQTPPPGAEVDNGRKPGGGGFGDTPPQGKPGPDTPPRVVPGSGTQPPGGNGQGPGSQPPGGQGPGAVQPPGSGEQPDPGGVTPPNGNTNPSNFPPPKQPSWTPPVGGGNPTGTGVDIPRPGTQVPGAPVPSVGVPVVPTGGLGGGQTQGPGKGIPGEGRFGRGPGGAAEPVTAAGRGTASGAPGGRGAGGASGLGPGAGRSNRKEDKEHQRKYVVLDDEHLLDDGPPVAPPVIGER